MTTKTHPLSQKNAAASPKNTVILGATGKTGHRVAQRLVQRGLPVRAVSRSTSTPFDWHDESTWEDALAGAGAMYITYQPDLAIPGAFAHVEQISEMAVKRGVERIVLLAGRGEPQVHAAEQAVRDAGVDFTILECAFFAQNFSEGILAPIDGTLYFPAGDTAEPFIDCDDIADVAVEALTDGRHNGQTYELTGPDAITFGEATAAMSAAAGVPLRYVSPSFDEYAKALAPHMAPAEIDFFIELFRYLLDGHNSHTTGDVERVLGRPARDFFSYAQGAASAWKVAS